MDENGLEIEHLADYSGRIIRPVGSIYKLTAMRVSEMTDDELASHIKALKVEIKEAAEKLDQKRVLLTIAEGQSAENDARKFRRLRNVHVSPGGIRISAGPHLKANFGEMIARWKANGKSNEEIYDILSKLKELVERSNKRNGSLPS